MTRKWIDCRDFGDDTGCTLYISGEEEQSSTLRRSTPSRCTARTTRPSCGTTFVAC
jgi:hypothetical protein